MYERSNFFYKASETKPNIANNSHDLPKTNAQLKTGDVVVTDIPYSRNYKSLQDIGM